MRRQPATVAPAESSSGLRGAVNSEFQHWLAGECERIDSQISKHLKLQKSPGDTHSKLLEAVEYSMQSGGKRFRPTLVIETCRVCWGREDAAWPAAVAVECVHAFSLIHDDLPAMDDDDLRRGRPTTHKVFGEALAILAGDWLLTHAFGLLATERKDSALAIELVRTLADGSLGMVAGQALDIAAEGQPADQRTVELIHTHKTARLLEACTRMGALCARAPAEHVERMADYGRHLGLAFQIADDLLDVAGSTAKLGKRSRKDAQAMKQTYPAAFGVGEAQARAQREVGGSIDALEPFGARAERLRQLAEYVTNRER